MKTKLFLALTSAVFIALFVISCGKKEDPPKTDIQNQQQQQTQQQQTQQQQTQQQQTQQQQKQTDPKKEEEKKKEDEKKKEEDKKKADEKLKEEVRKTDSVRKLDMAPGTQIDFSQIWSKKCVKCHGKNGTGKVEGVPDLTKAETKKKNESELIKIITNGVKGKTDDDEDMPAWKGKLTEEEIKAAAMYVRGL